MYIFLSNTLQSKDSGGQLQTTSSYPPPSFGLDSFYLKSYILQSAILSGLLKHHAVLKIVLGTSSSLMLMLVSLFSLKPLCKFIDESGIILKP